ncbi:hypothetical protein DFH28DRAFT_979961 [Melampsora americana]|nr:hypothetical protein DFH28DRAFT_979961 [Melampsora americana]
MPQKSKCVSIITILLNLALGTYVLSFPNRMNIQPDRIKGILPADNSVSTSSRIWEYSESSLPFRPQFTRPQESTADEAQTNAHLFHKDWLGGVHLPRRFEKARVKRSPALGRFVSGLGTNTGRLSKGSDQTETISDVFKASDVAESNKVLRGDDNPRLDRAKSFPEESKLDPVQTPKRVSFAETLEDSKGRQAASKEILKKSLETIAADAYMQIGKVRSSTVINPLTDATKEMVKKYANEAHDMELIFEAHRTMPNMNLGDDIKEARKARRLFKYYIETYARNTQKSGIDYSLIEDLQRISNRREIRLETKLSWSDNIKSKIRKLLYKFISIFKGRKDQKSSSVVSPETLDSL